MTVNRLRELDHDVRDIRGGTDQGLVDTTVWDIAVREGRLLITTGKGFAVYRTKAHNGILIVRLRQPNRLKIHQSVIRALERFGEAEWPGLLVVMRDATMSTSCAGGPVER